MKKIKITACLCTAAAVLLLLSGCKNSDNNKITGDSANPAVPAAVESESESFEIQGNNEKTDESTNAAAPAAAEHESESFDISVKEISKHGNVRIDTSFDGLKDRDIEPGDIITITVGDQKYDLPVGTSYSDVDSGCMICRFDIEDQKVTLAVNGGSFAEITGMAEKQPDADNSGFTWNVKIDKVSIVLKEKKGYLDEFTIRSMERSNERSDYANLSDDDFANCREVSTTGIKPNTLFRGTTPIDPKIGRSEYAMKFIESNKIRTIMNLCNTYEEMTGFEAYPDSYYSKCEIMNAVLDYKYASEEFASKVKSCVLYINENDGPFYIHCKEGKDRTGVICAVLECYFGASYDEIKSDYIKSFENFYNVDEGSDAYDIIIHAGLEKILSEMFGVTDLSNSDLRKAAEKYLVSCQLTESDLSSLAAKIGE